MVGPDAAVFAYAQLTSTGRTVPAPVRLPGLDPARHYEITHVTPGGAPRTQQVPVPGTEKRVLPGRVLTEVGVRPPVMTPEQAWLIHLKAV